MSLKELDLKIGYRSDKEDELIKKFYIPVLSNAILYKRAVGYFSSNVLLQLSRGISKLINNGGKIQIIASPELNQNDIEAIKKGYKLRDEILEKALLRNFKEPKDEVEEERYNYLAHLISNNQLDIKIALIDKGKTNGIYHEKIGIVEDEFNNKLAFTGSLNETQNAVKTNFESIDVYCSWKGGTDLERVQNKYENFKRLWQNKTNRLTIYNFPDAVEDKILNYKKNSIKPEEKMLELRKNNSTQISLNLKENYPKSPEWIELRDYQQKAIQSWRENNYVGLLNMATGTGKTITSLAAITKLWSDLNDKLAVIIVCPYTHLVEQWREDIIEFNMNPIIAYSSSDQRNWKKNLDKKIHRYNLDVIKHICVITTNGTYKTEKFQNLINRIHKNVVLIIDEVHNAGASGFLKVLTNNEFEYRLALSATPNRHFDEEGTSAIFDYFDKETYNFGLKKAIDNDYLTQYYYYPQIVYLTDKEYDQYIEISKKVYKNMAYTNDGNELTEVAKRLLIKRARLVAGASNKLDKLKELMKDRTNSNYNLIYCGATYVENEFSKKEMKQIEAVTRILGNELNMRVAKFTAEESMEERKKIINNFSDGETLQAIAAIKCLDEGVDIPAIENAYILASSTNPREFIQRRGRVLRKFKGKSFAYIYDFITLPRPIEEVPLLNQKLIKYDISLIKKEIKRAKEFAGLAENHYKALRKLEKIEKTYDKYSDRGGDFNG